MQSNFQLLKFFFELNSTSTRARKWCSEVQSSTKLWWLELEELKSCEGAPRSTLASTGSNSIRSNDRFWIFLRKCLFWRPLKKEIDPWIELILPVIIKIFFLSGWYSRTLYSKVCSDIRSTHRFIVRNRTTERGKSVKETQLLKMILEMGEFLSLN